MARQLCDWCGRPTHADGQCRSTAREALNWLKARRDESPDDELGWLVIEFIEDFGLEDGDG